jgi:DNA-directed RNA polymerase sigma subunit (sigma70/sigma32)
MIFTPFLWCWFAPLLNHRILTTDEEVIAGRVIAWHRMSETTISEAISATMNETTLRAAAEAAKSLLVAHNIRFADCMIKNITRTSYYAKRVPLDILRSEAILGLYKAASKYGYGEKKTNRESRFSTFAAVYVKDAVLRAITRQRQDEGFPLKHHEVILLNRAKKLSYKMGLTTDEEVAAALKISVKRYRRIRSSNR